VPRGVSHRGSGRYMYIEPKETRMFGPHAGPQFREGLAGDERLASMRPRSKHIDEIDEASP